MASFSTISGTLASAVAPSGTFTVAYPAGKDGGIFGLSMAHKLDIMSSPAGTMGPSPVGSNDAYFFPQDFDISFGASGGSITVTNKTAAVTWPAGAQFRLQMMELGDRSQFSIPLQDRSAQTGVFGTTSKYGPATRSKLVPSMCDAYNDVISLGAPAASVTNGVCTSQSLVGVGTAFAINGSLSSGGVATFDQPRAVQIVSGGADTAVLTITGTDIYGQSMSEAVTLNGTTVVFGKKAFKTITSVTQSATTSNGVTVGSSDILGLPVFVGAMGFVVKELVNGTPVNDPGGQAIPFFINQTDLLAPTAADLVSPVNGFIVRLRTVVQANVTTGGTLQAQVNGSNVAGCVVTVASSATKGTVGAATPTTPFGAAAAITTGSRLSIVPASFATAGAVNGVLEVTGTAGTFVAGMRTGGGSTTTTGDVRGTYKPPVACDGSTFFHLMVDNPERMLGAPQNIGG